MIIEDPKKEYWKYITNPVSRWRTSSLYLDKLVSKLIWKIQVKCTDLKGTYSWSGCSQRTKFAVERVGNDNCLDSLALLNVLTILRHFFWLIFLYRVQSLQTYDVWMNSSRNIKVSKLLLIGLLYFLSDLFTISSAK